MAALSSILVPAAISSGTSILGNLLTDQPEVPDLRAEAIEEVQRARRERAEQAEAQRQDLEESLAAQNVGAVAGSSAREEMFDAQASAASELESRASEIISDAIRRERMMEFQQRRRRNQNRMQAISSLGQGAAIAAGAAIGGGSEAPEAPDPPRVDPNNSPISMEIPEFDPTLELGGPTQSISFDPNLDFSGI